MDWQIFFSRFLADKEIFFEFISIIDENIFQNAVMTNMFIIIRKFFVKYKKQPDFDTLYILLDRLPDLEKDNKQLYVDFIDSIKEYNLNIDIDVLRDEITKAIQTYEMEKFILKSANQIGNITFDDMLGDIRTIVNKHKPESFGTDVSDTNKVIKMIRHDVSDKITSGIEGLDKMLYGGYGTNEIAIIMAPPGRGKSYYLINAMYGAMLVGKSVLYITYELSEKAVLKRLYSRISQSTRKEMIQEEQITKAVSKFFRLCKAKGKVIYLPSRSVSVEGIESLIEKQQLYFDFSPDMIIVDYLDLIAPRSIDYKGELRHRLRNITDDLRSISLRRNIAVLSATQANRASLAKMKITEANTAESFGKIEVSDVVLAICQTDEERKLKRARLSVLKNRDYVAGGCIEIYVDFEKMTLLDVDMAVKLGEAECKKDE